MPVSVSYPGVYVEELPSGVRTITGVATSITAFVGKAVRGPVERAGDDHQLRRLRADVRRPARDLTLGYAVRDFFLNGGAQAVIVRLYKADGPAAASFEIANLTLEAATEGAWGMQLRVRVDKKAATDPNLAAAAARLGVAPADVFDLTSATAAPARIETFLNLTTKESARRADRVLADRVVAGAIDAAHAARPPPAPAARRHAHRRRRLDRRDQVHAGQGTRRPTDAVDSAARSAQHRVKTGLYALEKTDLFNLLCIPPDARDGDVPDDVYQEALGLLREAAGGADRRSEGRLEPISSRADRRGRHEPERRRRAQRARCTSRASGRPTRCSTGSSTRSPASGMVAGVMARTDAQRGVWKAPAGIDAALNGVAGLQRRA